MFNCLVYKDIDVVEDMINNINKFIKDPLIVIHVNKEFEDFNFNRISSMNNVIINSDRFNHKQYDTKTKALTSNHNYANQYCFDYEVIFYPKMLFIKNGLEEYIDGVDVCMPMPTQEKRDQMEYALNTKMDVFTEYEKGIFVRGIEKCLVEGMVLKSDIADKLYRMISSTALYDREGHCYEEFIFPTIAKHFSNNIKDYPGIIGYGNIPLYLVDEIINKKQSQISSFFTDDQPIENIFFVHKVDYGYEDEVRNFIRRIND
jgi:hypothetical protein